jgi:hypothetical protein
MGYFALLLDRVAPLPKGEGGLPQRPPLNAYGGLGVRAKYLLKPDAAGLKVAALASLFDLRSSTLTPALSRRERVSYTSRGRFMSMTLTTVLELRPVI